jgi:hypothetical protein
MIATDAPHFTPVEEEKEPAAEEEQKSSKTNGLKREMSDPCVLSREEEESGNDHAQG